VQRRILDPELQRRLGARRLEVEMTSLSVRKTS
jgi:hypothetical protein